MPARTLLPLMLTAALGCSDKAVDEPVSDAPGTADTDDIDPASDTGTVEQADSDGDGWSAAEGDCDDTDALLNPGDADGDGHSTCEGDCDDTDADLNLDDRDGDGYSTCDGDPNDEESSIYPGAEEVCGDGLDNDGDGLLDCEDGDCWETAACGEDCTDGTDNDLDGVTDCADADCWGTVACPVVHAQVRSGELWRGRQQRSTHGRSAIWRSEGRSSHTFSYWYGSSWGWMSAHDVRGTAWVSTASSTRSCSWWVDSALASQSSGGSSMWRRGFGTSGGCALSGSSFLPALLPILDTGSAPEDAVDGLGRSVVWYQGSLGLHTTTSTTTVHTHTHGDSSSGSSSRVTQRAYTASWMLQLEPGDTATTLLP